MTPEQILEAAYLRGRESGERQAAAGYRNDSPLSGEWAGESMPELFGDLVDKWAAATGVNVWESDAADYDYLADEYERGHADGQAAIFGECDACGVTLPGNGVATCGDCVRYLTRTTDSD